MKRMRLPGLLLATAVLLVTGVFALRLLRDEPEPAAGSGEVAIPAGNATAKPVILPEPPPGLSLPDRARWLGSLAPGEAAAWILRELEEAEDFATGADLEVGSGRQLAAWPSYRVFLLDMLHRCDPDLAGEVSRDWVERSDSPDEWAIALRNVAAADENGAETGWLHGKAEELLRNRTWQEDPSAGYLNAFDVIVHTDHVAVSPELLALCEDRERRAVRHASFLALDRLVQRNPEELLATLADRAHQYPGSGPMISNMVARADVRAAGQREAVEDYLLSGRRTAEELRGFASVFPNANLHVSANLLTETETLDGREIAERDRATLEVVEEWLEDEKFAEIRPVLETIRARLEKFVGE